MKKQSMELNDKELNEVEGGYQKSDGEIRLTKKEANMLKKHLTWNSQQISGSIIDIAYVLLTLLKIF